MNTMPFGILLWLWLHQYLLIQYIKRSIEQVIQLYMIYSNIICIQNQAKDIKLICQTKDRIII